MRAGLLWGFVFAFAAATAVGGCGSDDEGGGEGGTAGTDGGAGSAGKAGTAGKAGAGGSSGSGGASGTGGSAGSGGSAGTSGTAGESGTAGTSGTAGEAGSAGTAGESGTAGTAGAAGTAGGAGVAGAAGGTAQSCTGTAKPCTQLTSTECAKSQGCTAQNTCSGTPAACSTYSSKLGCQQHLGCDWNSGSCTGTQVNPCTTYQQADLCLGAGCSYSVCGGTPVPCDQIASPNACSSQPGCVWQ